MVEEGHALDHREGQPRDEVADEQQPAVGDEAPVQQPRLVRVRLRVRVGVRVGVRLRLRVGVRVRVRVRVRVQG